MKFLQRTLGVKELLLSDETLRMVRAMPIDTGELIYKKSFKLFFRPILPIISVMYFEPNASFSQSLSHNIWLISDHTYVSNTHAHVSMSV